MINYEDHIINFISIIKDNPHNKHIFNKIYKYYHAIIDEKTKFIQNKKPQEKIYCFINKITKIQTCKYCGKEIKFRCYSLGYGKYCNNSCMRKNNINTVLSAHIAKIKHLLTGHIKKDYELLKKTQQKNFPAIKVIYNLYKKNIDIKTHFLNSESTHIERMYCYLNHINCIPKCQNCKIKNTKFMNFGYGYSKFCSIDCDKKHAVKNNRIVKSTINKNLNLFTGDIHKDFYNLKKQNKFKNKFIKMIYTQYKNVIDNYTIFLNDFENVNYIERVYCYINNINTVQKCICGNKKIFVYYKYGYATYCSDRCKISQKEISKKMSSTYFKKTGYKFSAQNPKVFEQQQKTKFLFKDYVFPSGRKEKIQGYENYAIDILLNEMNYNENDIVISIDEQPEIWYEFENKQHRHYLDIFIPKENKIIEVKSMWTYEIETDKILSKKQSCEEYGYIYEIWIIDKQKLINVL